MAEPTLNDLTSIRGDAAIAGGSAGAGAATSTPAPVQFDQGLQFLNEASMARAAYNKYTDEQYQKNIADSMTNLRNIDFTKALPKDLPYLRQQFADLAKNVADNIQTIQNPASNQQKAAELTEQEAQLRGDIATSTAHNVLYTQNGNHLSTNPSWNTPQNQAIMSDFVNTPMDQRKNLMLQAPNDVNLEEIAKGVAPYAVQKVQNMAVGKDPNYLVSTEGQVASQDAYNSTLLSALKNTYTNGISNYQKFKNNYDLLPANLKVDGSGNSITPDQYIIAQAAPFMPKSFTATAIHANPVQMMYDKERFDRQTNAVDHAFTANQNALTRADNNKNVDPDSAAELNMKTIATIFKTGNVPPAIGQILFGDNSIFNKPYLMNDPNDATKTIKGSVKLPAITYKESGIDANGNIHIYRHDNQTNKALPAKVISPTDLLNALNNSYGPIVGPKIAASMAKLNQQYFNKVNPTPDDLLTHYGYGVDVRATTGYTGNTAPNVNFNSAQGTITTKQTTDPLGIR